MNSLMECVSKALRESDDLKQKKYQGNPKKFYGLCYILSEVLQKKLGKTWKPHRIKTKDGNHWFLKRGEKVLDLVAYHDKLNFDYTKAVRCAFLTKKMSKRARILNKRIKLQITKKVLEVLL